MADKKPSGMTLTTPAGTDLLFFERPADTTARYSTIAAIVQAQAASLTEKGAVELATTAEAQAGSDATRAVTPAGLAAYFDQTLLAGNAFKLKIPGQTRPEFFQLYTAEALFAGVYDPVAYWGFNVDGVGSRVNASLPAIYQQFEADYYVGGKHVQEWSFNCYPSTGSAQRYMAFVNNRDDYAETYWQFWVGNNGSSFFSVDDIETSEIYFRVEPTGGYVYSGLDTSVLGRLEVCDDAFIGSHSAALEVSRTLTPSSTNYGVDLRPTITPSAAITTAGTRNLPTYNTPASIAFNTIVGFDAIAPTINMGGGGATLNYAYTLRVNGAPTAAQYGNWALWATDDSGFAADCAFGASEADAATDPVDIQTGTLRQRTAKTPATAGASGRAGQICWDADYIYVCTATNTWKKVQIATW